MTTVVQSTYPAKPRKAVGAGQLADLRIKDIISRLAEDATIPFGRAVIQGTADNQCKLGAGGTFLGITVLDTTTLPSQGNNYVQKEAVAILERGCIWVLAGAAVEAGGAVYRTATGTLTDVATDNTLIANAYWETSAANGELAKLRLK